MWACSVWAPERNALWMDKHCVHTTNETAWHHNVTTHPNLFFTLQTCVSGSSDVQEDHSQEQRQEKKDVWVIYRDVTAAYVLGGLGFFFLVWCLKSFRKHLHWKLWFSQICCHPQLSERMKVVDVISSKVFSDSQQIIVQVTTAFLDLLNHCVVLSTCCAAAVLILGVFRVI